MPCPSDSPKCLLVVNFLFARFLVSTPVTKTDIRARPAWQWVPNFKGIHDQPRHLADLAPAPTAPKDDETIARTLGINILLATTDVLQIICLKRDFKVFDSTLAMLQSYDVHAATGFSDIQLCTNPGPSACSCSPSSPSHRASSSYTRNLNPLMPRATVRPRATGREAKASDAHALVHKEVGYTKGEEGQEQAGGWRGAGERDTAHAGVHQAHLDTEECAVCACVNCEYERSAGWGRGENECGVIVRGYWFLLRRRIGSSCVHQQNSYCLEKS
ncbi:hypothetical protein FIBSPDRAFT_970116 [Athelia psychrophila]|uniref:Uncharacterized protein n=1 Tax=Athelia psychrophila TaxID=1759441 RepID=A0A167SXE4_9AGAM|nr:hypothetical protein FIBSPDRAFT_970116 [Fibularhizoctonia sp. CBS 109695]